MPAFRYEATNAEGKTLKGSLQADSPRQARQHLRMQGLTPLALHALENTAPHTRKRRWFDLHQEPKHSEVVLLTRQLASLLQARLALAQALTALIEQAENSQVRERLNSIRSEVVAGAPLSQALAHYPRMFPELYVATVAAGENTGELGNVLSKLADSLEAQQALHQKITAAFIYPVIVTIVALMVVIGLLTWVVPQVVAVFESSHQELPLLTLVMIGLSRFLRQWGWLLVVLTILGTWSSRLALKNPELRLRADRAILRLPGLGPFARSANTSRLASTLAILVGSGVPILKALEAAARTLTNSALKSAMQDVRDRVKEGTSLSKALSKHRLFPPVLTHLVAGGEATGQLADMLQRAADSQRQEVERKALWLTSLMEPILILVMGLFVLLIVLAVMLPIIEINQLVQ